MSSLFELNGLVRRLRLYVERSGTLRPEVSRLLEEALVRGEIGRGEAARVIGLPQRSARRVVNEAVARGLLASDTPKGLLSLRFPAEALEILFPRLFPEA